jgi:hypothetical protein
MMMAKQNREKTQNKRQKFLLLFISFFFSRTYAYKMGKQQKKKKINKANH